MKLVDSVSTIIDRKKDIWEVESFLSSIAWASKKLAFEIVTRLNPKLKDEMKKRMPDLFVWTGLFVTGFAGYRIKS